MTLIVVVIVIVLVASAIGIYFSRKRIAAQEAERTRHVQEMDDVERRIEAAEKKV